MHSSVLLKNSIELINITPLNPLISKCQIKVCYVGDEPNRNRSIITRDVAKQMANSLPGSPIVGYYNEETEDFEEHNKLIEVANGKFKLKDQTRPYGFVDLNAKVWFAKYLDDDEIEREYLVTEGYLWTGQYPEAKRCIEKGNNQSMELDDKIINAHWTKDNKGKPQFFIINEAVISKLCILGEENEPCFEGANITNEDGNIKLEFSFEDNFKNQLFSMMEEIKNILSKGGASVMNNYAVEIGCALWDQLYEYLEANHRDGDGCPDYRVDGVYEENGQKFAILQHRSSGKYFQLNFDLTEENGFAAGDFFEVTVEYVPAAEPQFSLEEVDAYEATRYAAPSQEDEAGDEGTEEPATDPEEQPAVDEPAVDEPVAEEPAAVSYTLEEIPEYVELLARYNTLEASYNELNASTEGLNAQILELTEFKKGIERDNKKKMIDSFYMLSDDDKEDVIANIDSYSLDEIEAKLSVICVRNRVNFSLDENTPAEPMVYNLNGEDAEDLSIPAWLKAVQAVAKTM